MLIRRIVNKRLHFLTILFHDIMYVQAQLWHMKKENGKSTSTPTTRDFNCRYKYRLISRKTGKQRKNDRKSILDREMSNLRWCRATMDLLRATSAESKKEKKKRKDWIQQVEDRNRGGASLERGCGKRDWKMDGCFRRCRKGKCSDCRERKRAFRLTEYIGRNRVLVDGDVTRPFVSFAPLYGNRKKSSVRAE